VTLLEAAMAGTEEGKVWLSFVRKGLAGEAGVRELARRPLVRSLEAMTHTVLVPRADNFTPEARTPWGGTRIVQEIKAELNLACDGVVGESWEISGHPSFPNRFRLAYAGRELELPIGILERLFPEALYGRTSVAIHGEGMPFLVKLLNSGSWRKELSQLARLLASFDGRGSAAALREEFGVQGSLANITACDYDALHHVLSRLTQRLGEMSGDTHAQQMREELERLHQAMLAKNLSVQVHPTADFAGLAPGEHSKNEVWIIVGTEPGAGIYLDLKEGVRRETVEAALTMGRDVTPSLNFVVPQVGDVFFIPAGTIHALGAGILIIEPQETSETTYRVYDYGRLDKEGKPRKLHIESAIAATRWDGPRGDEAVAALRRRPMLLQKGGKGRARVELLARESSFETKRIEFGRGDVYESKWELFHGFLVLEGSVELVKKGETVPIRSFSKGQSFLVPAGMRSFSLKGLQGRSVVLETIPLV
jgi:mannose-6-phosphate isomerase class I